MSDRPQKQRKLSSAIPSSAQSTEASDALQSKAAPAPAIAPPVSGESVTPVNANSDVGQPAEGKILPPLHGLPGHSLSRMAIRPKLTVSQPNDPAEREADQVAEQVMRVSQPTAPPNLLNRKFVGHSFRNISVRASGQDAQLLTPELTQGMQQTHVHSNIGQKLQREIDTNASGTTASAPLSAGPSGSGTTPPQATLQPLIVEDTVEQLEPGQMRKRDFLAQLRPAVQSAAEEVLFNDLSGVLMMTVVNAEIERQFTAIVPRTAASLSRLFAPLRQEQDRQRTTFQLFVSR